MYCNYLNNLIKLAQPLYIMTESMLYLWVRKINVYMRFTMIMQLVSGNILQ